MGSKRRTLRSIHESMFWNRNLRIGDFRDARLIGSVCVASWLLFLAYVARLREVTHDAFHEMALLRAFFASGRFPYDDIFAFTPTVTPTVHHEWGTGLLLYWVAGISPLGLHGMAVFRVLLIALLGLVLYRVARNNGAHPLWIGLAAIVAFPIGWVGFATLRAQLFTLLFLSFQILLQQSDWRGEKRWGMLWWCMLVIWLNLHAGFVVGVAMLGLHMLERWVVYLKERRGRFDPTSFVSSFWHHAVLILAIPPSLCLNPWGADYPSYLWHALLMPRPTMAEWQPLWRTYQPVLTIASFAALVMALGYILRHRRWDRLRGWLFCLLAAYMALKHIRHGSLFAVVWVALAPGWLSPTPFGRRVVAWIQLRRQGVVLAAWGASLAAICFMIHHPIWLIELPGSDPKSGMVYPVGAVDYLKKTGFSGNVMTPFAAGAYLTWECYPQIRVSIDGRYEVAYRADVLPKHDLFYAAKPGWRSVLDEYQADAILVKQSAPVRSLLGSVDQETEHYRLVYEDGVFALFVQDSLSVGAAAAPANSLKR